MSADITVYVRRQLAATASVTTLLGTSDAWPVWIWRWRPRVGIEGTGKSGVVLSHRGGWAAPNRHNTAEFPVVQVEVYSDVTRDANLNPAADDAEERALEVCAAIRAVLHVPQGGEMEWGDVDGRIRIVGSDLAAEPDVTDVPDGDGVVRGLMRFQVVRG